MSAPTPSVRIAFCGSESPCRGSRNVMLGTGSGQRLYECSC